MKKHLFIIIFLMLFAFTAGAQKSFTLFKQVRYKNTPTSLLPFLQPFALANANNLLDANNTPRQSGIDSFANTCMGVAPINMDLESWPYYPDPALASTIDSFNTVISYFKAVNNHTPIGFYAVPPKQAYQWSSIDPVNNPSGYAGWKHISDNMAPLAANVDLFEPSFYSYDTDTSGWRKMVDTTIAAIKRYSTTKPIYAFIWPQYHGTGSYPAPAPQYQFIDTARWRFELEVLYARADGVIIWTSNKAPDGTTISWDVNMPWWQTTKAFMVEKQLSPPFVLDSFKVNRVANNENITWSTAVDTTTSSFIVQRSIDGGYNYQDISTSIPPVSTHYTENNYQYPDNSSAPAGSLQYRLKMFNKDGSITYSTLSVLPVSFISNSFSAQLVGKSVQLNWATESEQNNAYFEVLRSSDANTFNSIGTAPGNLTTSLEHKYSFTDDNPNSGVNYYKLQQVDIDGKTTYNSNIVVVSVQTRQNAFSVYIAGGQLNANAYSATADNAELMVISISGQQVSNTKVQLNQGDNHFNVDISPLQTGVYIAVLKRKNELETVKFIK